MTPRRLEAESLRDAILATSGQLDSRMGGPGYNIWEPNTNYVAVYKPAPSWCGRVPADGLPVQTGASPTRRSVRLIAPTRPWWPHVAMSRRRPSRPSTCSTAGSSSSKRLLPETAGGRGRRDRRVRPRGFRLAFGRAPSAAEREAAVALIGSHGMRRVLPGVVQCQRVCLRSVSPGGRGHGDETVGKVIVSAKIENVHDCRSVSTAKSPMIRFAVSKSPTRDQHRCDPTGDAEANNRAVRPHADRDRSSRQPLGCRHSASLGRSG